MALMVAVLVALAACSGGPDATAFVATSPGSIGVGTQRVLVAVIDTQTDEYLARPDLTPVATLRDGIGSPLGEYQGTYVPTIPGVRGMYSFQLEIPGPATYQLTIETGELGELGPIGLVASDDPVQVSVGEPAPRSETRTLRDTDIDDLTSDPDPEPAFYEMTVAEAVASGPSVILFATPAWCTSQSCGPMLDQVQEIAPDFPSVNFVHVEIYENIRVTDRSDLVLAPAVSEWSLPSEPWLFVVDGDGVITAAFEGAVADSELIPAIERVAG